MQGGWVLEYKMCNEQLMKDVARPHYSAVLDVVS